jgi:cytidyltransferase-like protein
VTNNVLTLGTFDLPHAGHMYLFEQCRKIAGREGWVHVAVNPDEFIEEFKGRPPIQTYMERVAILSSNKNIDRIYPTPGADAKPLIEEVNPSFIVIGVDWAPPKDYYAQLQITPEYLAERGIGLLFLDRVGGHSSTNLKARIRES